MAIGVVTTIVAGVVYWFEPSNKGSPPPDFADSSGLAANLASSVVRIEALDTNGRVVKAATGFFFQSDAWSLHALM